MRNQNESENKIYRPFRYDIDNPSHRETVIDFEKDFEASGFKGVGSYHFWIRKLGIIKFYQDDWHNYKIIDIPRYQNYQLKWSALQDLRIRREKAEVNNMTPEEREEFNKKRSQEIAQAKEEMSKIITPIIQVPQEILDDLPKNEILVINPEYIQDESIRKELLEEEIIKDEIPF